MIWSGCMSCCCANSASVLSPRTAASATLALKAAECVRRGLLPILAPVLTGDVLALGSSVHPHRDVQFCRASSSAAIAGSDGVSIYRHVAPVAPRLAIEEIGFAIRYRVTERDLGSAGICCTH